MNRAVSPHSRCTSFLIDQMQSEPLSQAGIFIRARFGTILGRNGMQIGRRFVIADGRGFVAPHLRLIQSLMGKHDVLWQRRQGGSDLTAGVSFQAQFTPAKSPVEGDT